MSENTFMDPFIRPAVAAFNTMNAQVAPDAEELPREFRPLQADGNPLAGQEITNAIQAAGGQIPFSRYMDLVLYGEGGYYSRGIVEFKGNSIESEGDFPTSPEISADFSTAMSIGVAALWGATGAPQFNLVEFGAGSGRMTKDILAALRNENPEAYAAVSAHISDYGGMNDRQRRVIGSGMRAHPGSYAARSTEQEHAQDVAKVRWVPDADLESVLDNGKPTIVISNEVPDAVCADVVRNKDGVLEQNFVALDGANQLVEQWLPLTDEVQSYVDTYGLTIPDGKEVAVSTAAVALQRRMARLAKWGGVIGVDYGKYEPNYYDNTEWNGQPVKMLGGEPYGMWYKRSAVRTFPAHFHPLQMPGELDITYDPDFEVWAKVSEQEGHTVAFKGTQVELLDRLGLPTIQQLRKIRERPGLSGPSIHRIENAMWLLSRSFRAIVTTSGIETNFDAPGTTMPAYRDILWKR